MKRRTFIKSIATAIVGVFLPWKAKAESSGSNMIALRPGAQKRKGLRPDYFPNTDNLVWRNYTQTLNLGDLKRMRDDYYFWDAPSAPWSQINET